MVFSSHSISLSLYLCLFLTHTHTISHLFFSHSSPEMEFEIYESELADYSLQDSPFYESSTPIIFGLTANPTIAGVFASNNSASMVDALNLSSKKSSIMMSAKCQSLKLAFERTSNSNGIGKCNDSRGNINDSTNDSPTKKHFATDDRFFSTKTMHLNRSATDQSKKERKRVSFLPNCVEVSYIMYQYFL